MPLKDIKQKDFIYINDELRLRSFDDNYNFALKWYEDLELVKLVDGIDAKIYDIQKLKRMYEYLNNNGELYFIEVLENNIFTPIGDVTLCYDNIPIVIGDKRYFKKGLGKKVLLTLIKRARGLNFEVLKVNEIYNYNISSQKLFESVGFEKRKKRLMDIHSV